MAGRSSARLGPGAVSGLLARPKLWPGLVLTARSLVARRWWTRAPFLPLPDRAWMAFRLETAYGGSGGPVAKEDLIGYLEWRRHELVKRCRANRLDAN